jgi:hypothetical protein
VLPKPPRMRQMQMNVFRDQLVGPFDFTIDDPNPNSSKSTKRINTIAGPIWNELSETLSHSDMCNHGEKVVHINILTQRRKLINDNITTHYLKTTTSQEKPLKPSIHESPHSH